MTPICGSTYRSEECLVNLVNWKSGQLKISYFPGQKVGKYAVRNKSYVVNDTFCYYSDIDNSIYQVSEDTVTLHYYLDKGSFKNFRLCGKAGYSDNCLTVISDINRMQCCDYTITGTRACVSATIICIFIFPLLITV